MSRIVEAFESRYAVMMVWLRTWQLGIKSLLLHPMRSILTVLGIFIGVASVIALLAIGEGISKKAQEQIENLGAQNIMVRSVKPPDEATSNFGEINAFGITRAEKNLIEKTIPTVESVVPIRELPMSFGYTGNPNVKPIDGRLVGCTPEYLSVVGLEEDRGHFFTDVECDNGRSVCVLAAKLAGDLFPSEDPIDKQLFIPERNEYYKIVGVLRHKEATAAIGGSLSAQDFSRDVYIPITTMKSRFGDRLEKRTGGSFSVQIFELSQLTLRVKDVKDVPKTAKLVDATLRRTNDKRQDIAMVVPYELLEQAKTTKMMFMIFMGLIAAISLVVGGIGIMNIMLATVTERTREIGIRRALGAKRSDIIHQFLVETIVLSVVGGLTGILFGLLCPTAIVLLRGAVERVAPKMYASLPEATREMTPEIVWESIPLAFGISVVVGVVFGVYPAIRAAKMDPIDALRHE